MNKFIMPSGNRKTQKGMTFIEVLIALVIIVTGILGAVAMQATAKQASFDAMQRSLASSLAQDIIARMRANDPANLEAYALDNYGDTLDAKPELRCDLVTALCNSTQLATNDRYEWELALLGGDVTDSDNNNTGGLINGRGCITYEENQLEVVVSWYGRNEIKDINKSDCADGGGKRRQVVVHAFII
ncbi:MAG: type IV pilus modification protein PilV [Colwellia sp.]